MLPRVLETSQNKSVLGDEESTVPRNQSALLVDDDPDARLLVSMFLTSLGFQVTKVVSASESDAHEEQKFNLLVRDVMLPGQRKGTDLARKFREKQPEPAILYMSGFQQGILTTEDLEPHRVCFKQKAFSRDDFSAHINKPLQLP